VLALCERAGGLEQLAELEVQLVRLRPIPEALIRALERAPVVPLREVDRKYKSVRWGMRDSAPEAMPPSMRLVLKHLVDGRTDREIASATGWRYQTVRDLRRALLGVFRARNSAHLAALAVASGCVRPASMTD
jgi:DNA-binding NarL/FixJ family response regulator